MAERIVPHFHNTAGVREIEIGAREFMCIGVLPPFDHPHIYIDLGGDSEAICTYCSTLFRFNAALEPAACIPPDARYAPEAERSAV